MAKKAGSKVGEAFVELGLDTNPLVNSLKSAQATFASTLKTMSTQASKFGSALGKGLGLGGMLGAGGLAGGLALAVQKGLAMEDALKKLGFAANFAGRDGAKLLQFVDGLLPSMRELYPATVNQNRAIGALGTTYGKAGEELRQFMRQSFALAQRTGDDPVATALKYAEALRRPGPGTLSQFGIPEMAPGTTPRDIREHLIAVVKSTEAAAKEAMALPSQKIALVKAKVSDWFSALGQAAIEGAMGVFSESARNERKLRREARERAASVPVPDASKLTPGVDAQIDRAMQQGLLSKDEARDFRQVIRSGGKSLERGGVTRVGRKVLDVLIGTGRAVRGVFGFAAGLDPQTGQPMSRKDMLLDYLDEVPSAAELRGRSQRTEDTVSRIGAASEETNYRMFGLTGEERAARGGGLWTPERLALSDDEVATRRELTDATKDLTGAIREWTQPGIASTFPFLPSVAPIREPFP
jgi:hypothetical protein